jgi:hypothetical protein
LLLLSSKIILGIILHTNIKVKLIYVVRQLFQEVSD